MTAKCSTNRHNSEACDNRVAFLPMKGSTYNFFSTFAWMNWCGSSESNTDHVRRWALVRVLVWKGTSCPHHLCLHLSSRTICITNYTEKLNTCQISWHHAKIFLKNVRSRDERGENKTNRHSIVDECWAAAAAHKYGQGVQDKAWPLDEARSWCRSPRQSIPRHGGERRMGGGGA